MEALPLILTTILIVVSIVLIFTTNKNKTRQEESLKDKKYIADLSERLSTVSIEKQQEVNIKITQANEVIKQKLILDITIILIRQIENNLLNHIYTSISGKIEKPRTFNLLILPNQVGVELKALPILKDKSVPSLYLNISKLIDGGDVVSIHTFIRELDRLSYSSLETLYRMIQRNISK